MNTYGHVKLKDIIGRFMLIMEIEWAEKKNNKILSNIVSQRNI